MSKTGIAEKGHSAGHVANMSGVAAVDRAMAIVQALESAGKPLKLSEIAQATGLYKSAVLRLMVSLERCGLIGRRRDQSYKLGHFAFRLGKAYEDAMHVEEHLLPLMRDLVRQGFESPSFHVQQDAQTRRCLLRIDSNHPTLDRVRAGDLLPISKGAAGKVLLTAELKLGKGDANELIQVSLGERDPSCAAIAGPVYGPSHELLGALSLSGPLERFTPAAIAKMMPAVLAACEAATSRFGGSWPI